MMLTVMRHQPEPAAEPAPAQASPWQGERAIAFTLLLSLYGLFSAAFFLSRSYTVVMYLLIAVVVGHYVGARQRWPGVPLLRLSDHWMRWLAASVASIVALYVITTVLLIGS